MFSVSLIVTCGIMHQRMNTILLLPLTTMVVFGLYCDLGHDDHIKISSYVYVCPHMGIAP